MKGEDCRRLLAAPKEYIDSTIEKHKEAVPLAGTTLCGFSAKMPRISAETA